MLLLIAKLTLAALVATLIGIVFWHYKRLPESGTSSRSESHFISLEAENTVRSDKLPKAKSQIKDNSSQTAPNAKSASDVVARNKCSNNERLDNYIEDFF